MKLLNNRRVEARRYFWRTTQQQEIDYIEERSQQLFAYEFKWSAKKTTPRFPKTFVRNYENAGTKVITRENYEEFLDEKMTV